MESESDSSFSEDPATDPNKKKFNCSIHGCKKKFRRGWLLQNHIRKHNGERPFICDIENCTKSYTNEAHLKRHKCMVHDRSEEICCDSPGCGLVLSNKYSLKKHKNRVHLEANLPFSCTQCTKKFKKKRLLYEHMMEHSGPAPFRCERCNVDFYSQIKFTKHNNNHKTFYCDCGETFTKWTLFRQHRKQSCKIIINHKCIICYKVFSTKTNLTKHSMVHLEESKNTAFRCHFPNCPRIYKYKKNLNAHVAVFHEKQKDCKQCICQEPNCGFILNNERNLKRHMKNVHGDAQNITKRVRAPRKDHGKPKKSIAAILSGVILTAEENKALLNNKRLGTIVESKQRNTTEFGEGPRKKEFINHAQDSTHNVVINIKIDSNTIPQDHSIDIVAANTSQGHLADMNTEK